MSRLDIHDLFDARFDRDDGPVEVALYICTTPRTGSFTLCRYLIGQGWGVPTEYYQRHFARRFMRQWALEDDATGMEAAFRDYGRQLLARRVSKKIFAAKLMPEHVTLFNAVHPKGFDRGVRNVFVHLVRRDFRAQVASLVAASSTNRWSFSDVEAPVRVMDFTVNGESVHRACRYIIENNRFWVDVFRNQGIRPIRVETEELIDEPGSVIHLLSEQLDRTVDEAALDRSIRQERTGAYESVGAVKHKVLAEFGSVIEMYDEAYSQAAGSLLHST